MSHRIIKSLVVVSVAVLAAACQTAPDTEELTGQEAAALDAAVDSLEATSQEGGELEATPVELEGLGQDYLAVSRDKVSCPLKGVAAGIWYDVANKQVFEGSWFQLGTGELGGTLQGKYGDGNFSGGFEGTDVAGGLNGSYANKKFVGTWAVATDEGPGRDGQLAGVYERRNAYGGYFFGWWADCSK